MEYCDLGPLSKHLRSIVADICEGAQVPMVSNVCDVSILLEKVEHIIIVV